MVDNHHLKDADTQMLYNFNTNNWNQVSYALDSIEQLDALSPNMKSVIRTVVETFTSLSNGQASEHGKPLV